MIAVRQCTIGSDQHDKTDAEQTRMAHRIGELAEWVGAGCIHDVHHHQHQWRERHRQATLVCTQHQECFAESRQGKNPTDSHDPPIRTTQTAQIFTPDRIDAFNPLWLFWLLHTEKQQRHRQKCRDHRKPENRPEIVGPQDHQPHRQQRPEERAHRIQRLPQPERSPAQIRWRNVGDERIARCAANSLADAIHQSCGQHKIDRAGERKQRFRNRAEPVPHHGQRFALAPIITQRARENFHDQGCRFRYALDQSNREHARAERRDHEHRQQAMDQLGRDIH